MGFIEIVFIGVGLAMDAFAVAICKGLSMKKCDFKKAGIIAGYFGTFQAIMPFIGYFLGIAFSDLVVNIDHWVSFVLLCFIGGNMISEAMSNEEENKNDDVDFKTMIILALATSIDALAVGITFAFLKVNILVSIIIIGIITFIISFIGVFIGNKFGNKYESKAEFIGGAILIFIGLKILLEHLSII